MSSKITIGKANSEGKTCDTESWIYVDGIIRGLIRGSRMNVGSDMVPRWAITEYTVEIDDVETTHKTRGEAIAHARTVLV